MNTSDNTKTNDINIKQLLELKEGLLNINTSDDSVEESSSNSSDIKSKRKNKNKSRKIKDISNYIVSIEKLETRIHYLRLDIVNKDIEIEELKKKVSDIDKYHLLFKNIEFLFDRLNNAITVLNEKINAQQDDDLLKYLVFLKSTDILCTKTIDKYTNYLSSDIDLLFNDNQIHFKNAIISLFSIKVKELSEISIKIKNKISMIHIPKKYNIIVGLISLFIALCVVIIIFLSN